jgi:hypothetical protein
MNIGKGILFLLKIQPEEFLGITRQDLLLHLLQDQYYTPRFLDAREGLLAPTGSAKAFPSIEFAVDPDLITWFPAQTHSSPVF